MRAQNPLIRTLNSSIPFARHLGIEILHAEDGIGEASLTVADHHFNNAGIVHASVYSSLAEATSEAATFSAFAEVLRQVRTVASQSTVYFLSSARSNLHAVAKVRDDCPVLRKVLAREGNVLFPVDVQIFDVERTKVFESTVDWHVSLERGR